MSAYFHLLAFKLLGIKGLPLPRMDGCEGDIYFTDRDDQTLCNIVCELVPGITASDWCDASQGRKVACLEEALRKRNCSKPPDEVDPYTWLDSEEQLQQRNCTREGQPADEWTDYRYEGNWLTAQFCKDRFGVTGKDLSTDVKAKETRRKNPDGRVAGGDYVYSYDVVSRISNRKSRDK